MDVVVVVPVVDAFVLTDDDDDADDWLPFGAFVFTLGADSCCFCTCCCCSVMADARLPAEVAPGSSDWMNRTAYNAQLKLRIGNRRDNNFPRRTFCAGAVTAADNGASGSRFRLRAGNFRVSRFIEASSWTIAHVLERCPAAAVVDNDDRVRSHWAICRSLKMK